MLTAALICTSCAASCNWYTRVRPHRLIEAISKPLTTLLVMWIAVAAGGGGAATVLAVVGLVFCLAGDIALLDVVDEFLVGLACFLLGHVVFIAMFVSLDLRRPAWGVIAGVVLTLHVAVVGRRIVSGATRAAPQLRAPIVAYLVVISCMAVVAAATGKWWVVGGALAFVLSDTLLGWRAFVGERRWSALTVMVTYHAALVGIALGVG